MLIAPKRLADAKEAHAALAEFIAEAEAQQSTPVEGASIQIGDPYWTVGIFAILRTKWRGGWNDYKLLAEGNVHSTEEQAAEWARGKADPKKEPDKLHNVGQQPAPRQDLRGAGLIEEWVEPLGGTRWMVTTKVGQFLTTDEEAAREHPDTIAISRIDWKEGQFDG